MIVRRWFNHTHPRQQIWDLIQRTTLQVNLVQLIIFEESIEKWMNELINE